MSELTRASRLAEDFARRERLTRSALGFDTAKILRRMQMINPPSLIFESVSRPHPVLELTRSTPLFSFAGLTKANVNVFKGALGVGLARDSQQLLGPFMSSRPVLGSLHATLYTGVARLAARDVIRTAALVRFRRNSDLFADVTRSLQLLAPRLELTAFVSGGSLTSSLFRSLTPSLRAFDLSHDLHRRVFETTRLVSGPQFTAFFNAADALRMNELLRSHFVAAGATDPPWEETTGVALAEFILWVKQREDPSESQRQLRLLEAAAATYEGGQCFARGDVAGGMLFTSLALFLLRDYWNLRPRC